MKNRKILNLLSLTILSCIFLSGCSVKLSETEGFELLQEALDTSMNAEIFYWKELDLRDPDSKISTTANVHCKVDDAKYEYVQDENGHYVDKKVNIIENVNSKKRNEIFCGVPKGETKSTYVKIPYSEKGEELKNEDDSSMRTMEEMSVNEFLASKEFEPYTLSEKLKPILSLKVDDLKLISKEVHKKAGESVILNYTVSDSFLSDNPDSILKGSKLYIELAYGKIANFTVYKNVSYGSNLQIDEEMYVFKVVYLGPKINVPNSDV